MSESGDSGPGRREVAHRLFAAEFDDADFSYSESDEERAPNYVVTPTGARVNRLFLAGVLTELEQVNDDVLRARVVDPTGPFVIYAGQYQPDELAFLEAADPPMFVAVTGKARTFQPDDSDRVFTSVRPESISEVDADTRDRWVVQAAEQTVSRIGQMASAKQAGLAGDELRLSLLDQGIDESSAAGITLALDHYGTTGDYLDALRTTALDAARVVAGDTDEAAGLSLSPGDGTDDPIPLLASLDLDTEGSTPETTGEEIDATAEAVSATDDAEATEPDEPAAASADSEPTTDEDVADAAEAGAPAAAADAEPAPDSPGAPAGDESPEPSADAATSDAPAETPETATAAGADETTAGDSAGADAPTTPTPSEPVDESPASSEPATDADSTVADEPESSSEPDADDDLGEFDPEFELDDDEREEIEQEYGTDFQSGTEVNEPGEAGIETPDPEDLADAAEEGAPADAADAEPAPESAGAPAGDESPEPSADAATSDAPAETPETATDAGADETTAGKSAGDDASAEDVDLEDAVMEVMEDLDDGSGADREELLAAVVDRYGADPDAVEDAIQDALMGGRCYEPDDGKLTPI
ncbi:hypothetical protein NDI54_16340 [Haloarcula sp. S1AR25-5A]|uniref:Rpa-associated protein n=1 Tax=Haloarcula terrestris TaxID=2950533 RepID=A0AAE4EZB4_9EURY|nr:hypothetical protein [Haloarcula terrestris]MDS0222915.1 hypothetical protein [Haloarcula terrestris]